MRNEQVLLQTKYSKIILIRPLFIIVVGMVMFLFLPTTLVKINIPLASLSLLGPPLFFGGIIALVRSSLRYFFGRFIVTTQRVSASGERKSIDILINRLEGIDVLVSIWPPYPIGSRMLRIRGIGGNTVVFHDVAKDADLRDIAYYLAANLEQQY
jgi:hypothetical protein